MKAMSLVEARYAVARLDPHWWQGSEPGPMNCTQGDVDGVAAVLSSKATLEAFLDTMFDSAEDLPTLRLLLVNELTLRAREPVATLLLIRHEGIVRKIRIAAVLDCHPTLAVYWDKVHKVPLAGKKRKPPQLKTDHLAGGLFPAVDSKWNKM